MYAGLRGIFWISQGNWRWLRQSPVHQPGALQFHHPALQIGQLRFLHAMERRQSQRLHVWHESGLAGVFLAEFWNRCFLRMHNRVQNVLTEETPFVSIQPGGCSPVHVKCGNRNRKRESAPRTRHVHQHPLCRGGSDRSELRETSPSRPQGKLAFHARSAKGTLRASRTLCTEVSFRCFKCTWIEADGNKMHALQLCCSFSYWLSCFSLEPLNRHGARSSLSKECFSPMYIVAGCAIQLLQSLFLPSSCGLHPCGVGLRQKVMAASRLTPFCSQAPGATTENWPGGDHVPLNLPAVIRGGYCQNLVAITIAPLAMRDATRPCPKLCCLFDAGIIHL